ncbi:MAG: toprim domain-containing protein [Prosthecobacter sp.]|nr:toprim domain-containing protein [Prosthecobacter sp.]
MSGCNSLADRVKAELSMLELIPHAGPVVGNKIRMRCPLPGHEDKHASFLIYLETNSWWCPSHPTSRNGGSPIDYIMLDQNLDVRGALRYAANLKGWNLTAPTEEERVALEARHKREDALSALVRYAHGQLCAELDVAKEAREYLAGRGFEFELLRDHQVGLLNLEKLYQVRGTHPLLADFNQADFEEAGLRSAKGGLLFRGTRIAFPLLEGQRVVGVTFRAMPGSPSKPKFILLAGLKAGLWNGNALRNPERKVIVAEGVPDAMTLAGWGIPAVGNMGLQVAKNAHRFECLKEVTVVFDNDDAGQSRLLPAAIAIQRNLKDGIVKVLTLPGENDVNDWARAGGTAEAFRDLWEKAPELLEVLISRLPTEADRLREGDLVPVLEVIRKRPSLGHEALLKRVIQHVPVRIAELRKRLKAEALSKNPTPPVPPAQSDSKPATKSAMEPGPLIPLIRQVMQPGLSLIYDNDIPTWRMGVNLLRLEPSEITEGKLERVPCKELIVVQDLPDGLKVTTESFRKYVQEKEDWKRFPGTRYPAWDQDPSYECSMFSFLEGKSPPVAGHGLYDEMKTLLTRHLWFPDSRDLDLVATWIVLTFVFPAFNAVPYLHFHGGKGSGKTSALNFVARLAFSALKCAGPTEAAASMHLANTSGTLIIDETEHLLNPRPGSREEFLLLILLIGYQAGAVLPKGDAESQQTVERCVFGPKCLGSIGRIQHVLRSRCLTIHTKEADPDHLPEGDLNHDAREVAIACRSLLNRLHVWSLRSGLAIHQRVTHNMRDIDRKQLGNRDRELWLPLFTIARHVDEERGRGAVLEPTLMDLRAEKEQEFKALEAEENPHALYLRVLADLLEDRGPQLMVFNQSGRRENWYPAARLLIEMERVLHEQRLIPPFVTRDVSWLRALLVEKGVTEVRGRRQFRIKNGDGPSMPEDCLHIPHEPLQAALKKLCGPQEMAMPEAHLERLPAHALGSNTLSQSTCTGTDDIPF